MNSTGLGLSNDMQLRGTVSTTCFEGERFESAANVRETVRNYPALGILVKLPIVLLSSLLAKRNLYRCKEQTLLISEVSIITVFP